MIKVQEYKGITMNQIMELTGLPNRFPDQSKYSLARQKELLLFDVEKNNLLHLVEKTHPIKVKTLSINIDKDAMVTKLKEEDKINYTSNLDLTLIPHKVVKDNGITRILVNKLDIPVNVIKSFNPEYIYNVIGIFASHKVRYSKTNYSNINNKNVKVSSEYIFPHTKNIILLIVQ